MNMSRIFWVVALAAIWGVGCGSNSAGGSSTGGAKCTAVTACGGDLSGDWKVIGVCVEQATLDDEAKQICPTATVALESPKVTGSILFKADKTFVETSSTADATAVFTLPAVCLKQDTVTLTCDQVQTTLMSKDASAPSATCVPSSNGSCKCSLPVHESLMSAGTYALDGNSVTLTDGTVVEKQDYCVKGDKLYLLPTEDSALPGQLEFQKQ